MLGFGKASCDAALALEGFRSKIDEGVVIGLEAKTCEHIETYKVVSRPSPGK